MNKNTEYSYFKAYGRSRAAIDCVMNANKEIELMQLKLIRHFDADGISISYDENFQKYFIRGFIFSRRDPPEGWCTKADERIAVFAKPQENSKDAFYIASVQGFWDSLVRRAQLENYLGCGEMPAKTLPAGKYVQMFLREFSLEQMQAPDRVGHVLDRSAGVMQSGVPLETKDPLAWAKIGGDYYIRVPNDSSGKAVFVPYDSELADYDDLLEIDRKENEKARREFRGPAYGY